MTIEPSSLAAFSDSDLIAHVKRLAHSEREAAAELVAFIGEIDARHLYLAQGLPSMFEYCRRVLYLDEGAAYNRIAAARAARTFPVILERLGHGMLTLTAVRLVAPHLTTENHVAILDEATHASKNEVMKIVARLNPQPDVPATVRKLPTRAGVEPVPPIGLSGAIAPLSPGRYKVQMTVGEETYARLRKVQDLMGHTNPTGDVAVIFDEALSVFLERLERRQVARLRPKRAAVSAGGRQVHDEPVAPRPPRVAEKKAAPSRTRSRYVPASVRRAVFERDGHRCTFEGSEGRCVQTGRLELHHRLPEAVGGLATVPNLMVMCARHNRMEAEQYFGREHVKAMVAEARRAKMLSNPTRSGTSSFAG